MRGTPPGRTRLLTVAVAAITSGVLLVAAAAQVRAAELASPHLSLVAPAGVRSESVSVTVTGQRASFAGWRLVDATTGLPSGCKGVVNGYQPTRLRLDSDFPGVHRIALVAKDRTGVCHPPITASVLLERAAPWVVHLSASYTGGQAPSFRLGWASADGVSTSGIGSYQVRVADVTAHRALSLPGAAATRVLQPPFMVAGHAYTAAVSATDGAGNSGPSAQIAFAAPIDDSAFLRHGFPRAAAAGDYLGGHSSGRSPGEYLLADFRCAKAYVAVLRSPDSGLVDVWVDGGWRKRVDLYAPVVEHRQLLALPLPADGAHRVVLRPAGAHRPGARGNNVYVDSLVVGQAAPRAVQALFFGDSLFYGGGTDPLVPVEVRTASRLLHWQVTIDAIPGTGYTTGGRRGQRLYLSRLERDGLLDRRWDVIVLEGGTNDADHGSPAAVLPAARAAISYLRKRQPWARIVLAGAFAPLGATPAAYASVDRALAQAASDGSDAYVSQLRYGATWSRALFATDAFHPNTAGYAVLGRDLAAALGP